MGLSLSHRRRRLSLVWCMRGQNIQTGMVLRLECMVLFDYKKAFDPIDHAILTEKLTKLDLPYEIICWIVDFLKCRKQRIKLSNDCKSEWSNVPAGVPQGTKLGPWLFVLMIEDIKVTNTDLWKYVDDTTIAEPVEKGEISNIQNAVDELSEMSNRNKFQLNGRKCKEIRISFARCQPQFEPVYINDIEIEVVKTVKLLGLNISSDLKWNCHVSEIVKKASTRLYFIKQLKRAKIAEKELIIFYISPAVIDPKNALSFVFVIKASNPAEILLTLRVTIPDIGPSQVELWRGVTRMSQMY